LGVVTEGSLVFEKDNQGKSLYSLTSISKDQLSSYTDDETTQDN